MPDTTNRKLAKILLQVTKANIEIATLRLALEDQGILTPFVKEAASKRAQEIWGPLVKKIEDALAKSDQSLLEQLLREYKGPIQ